MSGRTDGSDGGVQVQDPSVELKPRVSIEEAPALAWRLYGLKASGIKELPSYDDLNYFFRAEGQTDNANINNVNPDGYVLKVMNSLQSANPVNIEANHALMRRTLEGGLVTQSIVPNKSGKDYSIETFTDQNNATLGPYIVRLVTYVPGTIFHETPYVAPSFRNVGQFIAKFHEAVKDFHHPFYDTYTTLWSLVEVPRIRDFLQAVQDDTDRRVVGEVVDDFENRVIPEFKNFRQIVIHGDINEQNLIMCKSPVANGETDTGAHDVAAILDFADSSKAYIVMDIAITIAYMSIECPLDTQLDVGGHLLAGYYKFSYLKEEEKKCLKTLVCARLCQSLVYGAHAYSQQPGNEYLLTTSKKGWPLLHRMWETDEKDLYSRWADIARANTNS